MCGGDDLLAWLPHHVRNDQTHTYTLTLYFLALPVCSLRFFAIKYLTSVSGVCVCELVLVREQGFGSFSCRMAVKECGVM